MLGSMNARASTGRPSRHPVTRAVEPTLTLGRWPYVLFGVSLALVIGWVAWVYPRLPERIPAHVGVSGEVDRWGGRGEFLILHGVLLGMAVLFGPLSGWVFGRAQALVNIPNPEYWKQPENWPTATALMARSMTLLGVLLVALDVAVSWEMAELAFGRPTGAWFFWVVMGLFMALTGVWIWWLYRVFRVPGRH